MAIRSRLHRVRALRRRIIVKKSTVNVGEL
jgi:hypothetical protein